MFDVQWTNSALRELATIWLDANSPGRRAITSATDRLDTMLSRDPTAAGESRSGTQRIVFLAPLVVVFSVKLESEFVRILNVGLYGEE